MLGRSHLQALRDARGKAAIWLLILVLVAGAAFAVWYFVLREQGGSGAARALAQRVLPASSDMVGGVDLQRLLTSDDAKKLLAELGVDPAVVDKGLADMGVAAGDLGALVFGATLDGTRPSSVVVALEAKTDAKAIGGFLQVVAAQLPGPLAGTIDPASLQVVEGAAGRGIFIVGSGPLLTEATALAKGGSGGDRKTELALIEKELGENALLWVAGPVPADTFSGFKAAMATRALGGTPTHFGAALGLGSDLTVGGAMHIPGADASTIAGALKTLQGALSGQAPEAVRPLLEQLVFGGNGPVVTATLKVDAKTLSSLKKTL